MHVEVTAHAIRRYKERMQSSISDDEIRKILQNIVLRGEVVGRHPPKGERVHSYVFNGLGVLAKLLSPQEAVVITFLGNRARMAWERKEAKKRYLRSRCM